MREHDGHEMPDEARPTESAHSDQGSDPGGLVITRRTALIAGSVGVGGLVAGGAGGLASAGAAAAAVTPLPTTTAPEQLRLEFGNDPATEMTVSWSAPGTVPMPAPTLAYSDRPISTHNRGRVVALPNVQPLDLTKGPRRGPSSTSFLDGQTGQTTYHYHVPLRGLRPDTTYHYEVSDGAGSTASAQFRTAPVGRASFRFTAFGDQGLNPPSPGTTAGVLNPGDGAGGPLFHLMVGDLAYANTTDPPSVWRPWALMIQAANSTFPWMPVPGNHELETGTTDITGRSSGVYNGPYGLGTYMARYLLPENGLTNWDGNTLQGNFYSFQVGTVLFVNLYGNDAIWQTSDFSSPNINQYTGDLKADPDGTTNLVPDDSRGRPNLQYLWLEKTLREARDPRSGVEMIVVQFHFPFASVDTGNSCDMGERVAWGALFDKYEVDITLSGHNHNYCRSLPVRGYDPPSGVATGDISNPFGTFTTGETVDTRRPTVRQSEPISMDGKQVFDTSLGTVHLVVGGGGAGSTIGETIDSETGFTQAHPFASSNGNNVQAVEDAPWLGYYDTANAYGYAVFDVDPGDRYGETSITFQWFSVPPTGSPLPTTPVETFTFTRRTEKIEAGEPVIVGRPEVDHTVIADPGRWSPRSARLSYQWLRAGLPIAGATSSRYRLTADDLGQQLQVQVTGRIPGNITDTATSASVVGTAGRPARHHVSMSGKLTAGGSLAAVVAPLALGASRKFQWLRDGEPISGATDSTYEPRDSDAGHRLQLQMTESVDGYEPVSAISEPQPVSGTGTQLTVPTLSTEPIVGQPVQTDGAVEDAAHEWLLDGAVVDVAQGASYTPVPADAGRQLQLKLTLGDQTAISEPWTIAAAAFKTASRPGFRGAPVVGGTLMAIAGPWIPTPELSYQWLADSEPIEGATEDTLVVPASCAGKGVSLRVTAERTGYVTRETVSDTVAISAGTLESSMPRIEGTLRVGETLNVIKGDWSDGAEFHYQWMVGGVARDGRSTGPAYKIRPDDLAQRITVEVTARKAGYEPVVRTSAATDLVRA